MPKQATLTNKEHIEYLNQIINIDSDINTKTNKTTKAAVVRGGVHPINQTTKEKESQLRNEEPKSSDQEYTLMNKKRKPKPRAIQGTATNLAIKGAVCYSYLHIYRLDPKVTIENLRDYLHSMKFDKILWQHAGRRGRSAKIQ